MKNFSFFKNFYLNRTNIDKQEKREMIIQSFNNLFANPIYIKIKAKSKKRKNKIT